MRNLITNKKLIILDNRRSYMNKGDIRDKNTINNFSNAKLIHV